MTHDPKAVEVLADAELSTYLGTASDDCPFVGVRNNLDAAHIALDALTAADLSIVPTGELERLRSVIDRCPFDDTPLQHDDENPQLKWWCGTCGHITDRPSALASNRDADLSVVGEGQARIGGKVMRLERCTEIDDHGETRFTYWSDAYQDIVTHEGDIECTCQPLYVAIPTDVDR